MADKRDQWHKNALDLKELIEDQEILVTDLIISEVLTEIGNRHGGKKGDLLYKYFKDNCKILYSNEDAFDAAEEIYLNHVGKLSIPDSLSIHVMNELAINKIVSFDSDFDKVKGITRVFK